MNRPGSPRAFGWSMRPVFGAMSTAAFVVSLAFLGLAAPAHADFVINATFDSSITSQTNAAAIEGAINAAIGVLEKDITSNVTVSIDFQATNSGLGQ